MGGLFVLLESSMEGVGVTVPWDGRGPTVIAILDLQNEGMFRGALERMALMERRVTSEWAFGC